MKLYSLTLLFVLVVFVGFSQQPVTVGSGSYAEYVPESVYDEGAYFGKTYRELQGNWPWYIHPTKTQEAIPTNDWWTAAVFEQYTGRLEAFPQRVEGTSSGIRVSVPTSFVMPDDRGLTTNADTWVEIKGTVDSEPSGDSEIFADFESEFYPSGWQVTENPPYPGPVSLGDIDQSPAPFGFLGSRFINTFYGDAPQFSMTSPAFTIDHNYIHMLVGGGNNPDDTYVGLFINGQRVLSETGENSGALTWRRMDVSAYMGQSAEVRIVDASSGGWGFIMCDNIVFSDSPEVRSHFSNSFWPQDAKVYDWSDLGVVFRLEDDHQNRMDGTVVHGVPFTFIDMEGVEPIVETSAVPQQVFDGSGALVSSFPVVTNTLVLKMDGDLLGVHAPYGSQFDLNPGGGYSVTFPTEGNHYLVVSWIPDESLIVLYDEHARNKVVDSRFEWDYQVTSGQIVSGFNFETKHYESGVANQPTLLALLPHHYRNTLHPSLIPGADYKTMRGQMHTTSGSSIEIIYDFGGMPPYLPEPLNLSDVQEQRLYDMITTRVAHSNSSRNGNTYAKGFGEETNIMLMAKQLDHPGFGTIRDNVKNELIDWLTYDPGEAAEGQYFFTQYPEFGALIGFPSGYGSQALNDLHFHYGYFIMGAARLMMVDDAFKNEYGEMVKEIAKSFANWKRYGENDDSKQPFLRTFDPYMGHSWAGGIGSPWDGNNQESTSEATHSWFAMYLLGVALEDDEIMSLGATGFTLEGIATANYWFNRHGDLPEEYAFDYVGINRANNLAMATYFHGDPAWAIGIQFVPCNFYYHYYLGDDPAFAAATYDGMLEDRITFGEATNTDYYENISKMGAYLGGYHLNYIQAYDPSLVASMLDDLYENEGGEWTDHVNVAVNYYTSNAGVTYGRPAAGYHTSLPTGAVYENPTTGELTYLVYNHSASAKEVGIYKDGALVETITVGSRQFYNSQNTNQRPVVQAGSSISIQSPDNSVLLDGSESYDSDGTITAYEWSLVSGGQATIASPNTAETLVNNLSHGVYLFQLKVTDNDGDSRTGQVTVTVLPDVTEINIALDKPAWASSIQEPWSLEGINDGQLGTRWGSEMGVDPQWVVIDLAYEYQIVEVILHWEGAFASHYEIQLSNDPDFNDYTVLASIDDGDGEVDPISVDDLAFGRYIRLFGIQRGTPYGYSLLEFEVYGRSNTTSTKPKDEKAGFDLFPNPSDGHFICHAAWSNYDIEIYSLQGIKLYEQSSLSGSVELNVSNLPAGIYLFRVVSGEASFVKRIVIL